MHTPSGRHDSDNSTECLGAEEVCDLRRPSIFLCVICQNFCVFARFRRNCVTAVAPSAQLCDSDASAINHLCYTQGRELCSVPTHIAGYASARRPILKGACCPLPVNSWHLRVIPLTLAALVVSNPPRPVSEPRGQINYGDRVKISGYPSQ